ncbi:guanylate kinase [Cryptosporangium arvum]|uniref:Guanylate kinase n=1 Tax=Cryptosporangium arvum DSM 44712 TaxID=927661 RepID=A0A010YMA0_9ACTN|nr:guanylate kinase [Cryptosporangium arvum DSM 44712]
MDAEIPGLPSRAADAARLTVLSGPSGVGKGSVVAEIRRHHPSVWLSVSVTTRAPRPGEEHGKQYYFVSRDEYDAMVAAGELLEHAEFAGNGYGTPRRAVEERLAAGRPALLEIELQGARQVRAAMPEAQFVFLAPPSWDELVRRLVGRGTEDEDTIRRRLDAAVVELAAEKEFDVTIVNDNVGQAATELVELLSVPVR